MKYYNKFQQHQHYENEKRREKNSKQVIRGKKSSICVTSIKYLLWVIYLLKSEAKFTQTGFEYNVGKEKEKKRR